MPDDPASALLRLQRSRVAFTATALRLQEAGGGVAGAARLAWLYLRLRKRLKEAERLLATPPAPRH